MRALSLYIHIPFCTRRCSYCSFYHVQTAGLHENAFVAAFEDEFDHSLGELGGEVVFRTVFIGGGTPSVLSEASLRRVFARLERHLRPGITEEVTVELNPEDVTLPLVRFFRGHGVTRASLGVQSMHPIAQKVLKRCPPEMNRSAIAVVMREFDNVSMDVLLGVPGREAADLGATIDELVQYRPAHFSVYCLEPGGDMSDEVEKFFTAVDDDRAADEYQRVCATLRSCGYDHYEVSNFALPGRESRHNRVYWDGGEYIGLGPGAHSFLGGSRWSNPPSLSHYLGANGEERVRARRVDPEGGSVLERAMLALRTDRGLALEDAACGRARLDEMAADGLLVVEHGRVRLRDAGFMVLNEIVLRVMSPLADGTHG